ncbi:MAG TPA: thioredoxin-dependent thiol peroxidase [Bacteroidota bacterium]|nr:thioredoxin-dependent thiol peroxidase [Bacteroidota bacterium]
MKKSKKPSKASEKIRPAAKTGLRPGDTAPDFSLPDGTGMMVSLRDFRGKKVVLYFYPRDSTPGCTAEACDFRDNADRIRRLGAVVLGVSADTVISHGKFSAAHALTFPLLSDENREAIGAYGAWHKKSFMGRSFTGIVRSTFVIDEKGKIVEIFPKVKVRGHVGEVLNILKGETES